MRAQPRFGGFEPTARIIRHRNRGTTNKAVAFSALFSSAILKAGF
jgi:hypothetical protein